MQAGAAIALLPGIACTAAAVCTVRVSWLLLALQLLASCCCLCICKVIACAVHGCQLEKEWRLAAVKGQAALDWHGPAGAWGCRAMVSPFDGSHQRSSACTSSLSFVLIMAHSTGNPCRSHSACLAG